MQASAKELRYYVTDLLDRADRGEEVVITYRGKPRAKLVSISRRRPASPQDTPLFGIWKNRRDVKDVSALVRQVRKGRSWNRGS